MIPLPKDADMLRKITCAAALLVLFPTMSLHAQEFLRGDVDGDGRVDPIPDALYLLDYGFNEGTEPPCEDSADVDGNEVVFPLVDSTALLNWAYDNGEAPPAPGVEACGADLDNGGSLGCETEPADCPADAPELEEDSDYLLSIDSATIDSNTTGTVDITISITNDGADISGFQFGVCHDSEILCVPDGAIENSGDLEDLDSSFFTHNLDGFRGGRCARLRRDRWQRN